MWITHSYLGTNRNGMRCLFFLLFQDYIEAENGFSKDVAAEIERFARDMGNFGAVVKPFAGDVSDVNRDILSKQWTEEQREELRRTPALLMIEQDFDDFDPSAHPWVVIHLEASNQGAAQLRSVLRQITDAVNTPDSSPITVVQQALRNARLLEASKAVSLKPGAFGINVDLRLVWDGLKNALRAEKASGQ